jgi:hypothetical protein
VAGDDGLRRGDEARPYLPEVRETFDRAGVLDRALYVERATTDRQRRSSSCLLIIGSSRTRVDPGGVVFAPRTYPA